MTSLKGKTYIEIYGEERAKEKSIIESANIKKFKIKFIEIWNKHGPFSRDEVAFLHQKYKGLYCGTTIKKYFGSFNNFEKEMNIKFKKIDKMKNVRISKKQILNDIKIIFKKYPIMKKTDINKLIKKGEINFSIDVIRNKFGNLDNLANNLNYQFTTWRKINKIYLKRELKKFFESVENKNYTKQFFNRWGANKKLVSVLTYKKYFGSIDKLAKELSYYFHKPKKSGCLIIGKNEKIILDKLEKIFRIKLERQKSVWKYFVDGYDKENNIVYEIDEAHHKFRKRYDKMREIKIVEILQCVLIRIDEQKFLQNVEVI